MNVLTEILVKNMLEKQWKELIGGLKDVSKDGKKIIKKELKIENIYKHFFQ
jgi:hypothetical protein